MRCVALSFSSSRACPELGSLGRWRTALGDLDVSFGLDGGRPTLLGTLGGAAKVLVEIEAAGARLRLVDSSCSGGDDSDAAAPEPSFNLTMTGAGTTGIPGHVVGARWDQNAAAQLIRKQEQPEHHPASLA